MKGEGRGQGREGKEGKEGTGEGREGSPGLSRDGVGNPKYISLFPSIH